MPLPFATAVRTPARRAAGAALLLTLAASPGPARGQEVEAGPEAHLAATGRLEAAAREERTVSWDELLQGIEVRHRGDRRSTLRVWATLVCDEGRICAGYRGGLTLAPGATVRLTDRSLRGGPRPEGVTLAGSPPLTGRPLPGVALNGGIEPRDLAAAFPDVCKGACPAAFVVAVGDGSVAPGALLLVPLRNPARGLQNGG